MTFQPLQETLQDQRTENTFENLMARRLESFMQHNEDLVDQSSVASPGINFDFDFPEDSCVDFQEDSSVSTPTPTTAQASFDAAHESLGHYSIKAGVCHHHLRYSNTLPWSTTEFDFDKRYCDECLERARLAEGKYTADLNDNLHLNQFQELSVESPFTPVGYQSETAQDSYLEPTSTWGSELSTESCPIMLWEDGHSTEESSLADSDDGTILADSDDEMDESDESYWPTSPQIGVSFSPEHLYAAEDYLAE